MAWFMLFCSLGAVAGFLLGPDGVTSCVLPGFFLALIFSLRLKLSY
jgi:hypothetical protein